MLECIRGWFIDSAQEEIEKWRLSYNNWRHHRSLAQITQRESTRRKLKQREEE